MSFAHPLGPEPLQRLATVTPLSAAADRGHQLAVCEQAWGRRFADTGIPHVDLEAVRAVRAEGERTGDEFLASAAAVVLLDQDVRNDRISDAIGGLVTAIAVLETYPTSTWLGRAHSALAHAFAELGENERAIEHHGIQREIGEVLDDLVLQAGAVNDIALLTPLGTERLDAFAAAEALFARASVDHEQAVIGGVIARLNRAETNAELGLLAAAADQLPYVIEMAASLGVRDVEGIALALQARCAAASGNPAEGLAHVEAALARTERLPDAKRYTVDVDCAGAMLACGRADLAIALLDTPRLRADPSAERRERALTFLAAGYDALGEHERAWRALSAADALTAKRLSETALARLDAMRIYHRTRSAERELSTQLDLSARLLDHVADLSEQHEEARDLVMRDDVTGLPNRRYLDLELRWRCSQRLPGGGVLVLVLVALDDHRAVLEAGGPEAAERLVVLAGKIIAGNVRAGDAVARFSPETFAVLQFHRSPEAARFAGERLRLALGSFPWSEHGIGSDISVSVGLAAQAPPTTPGALLGGASSALARAAEEGGDRVHLDR